MKTFLLILTAIFLVSLTSACFALGSQNAEPVTGLEFSLPKPTGKFGIGRQLIFLADESRPEADKPRQITAWIYYPTKSENTSAEESVLPPKWAESYRAGLEKRLGKSAANALLSVKTTAKTNAPTIPGKELFPVVVFAPGANWLPTDYSSIIEDLAANGYVVIAFAASPLSPVIQLPDGSTIESPRVGESTYGLISEDFRFIVGQIEKLDQDSSLKIKNRLDLNKIGTFGHSIGGAAAVSAASNNPKISAAINLDGDFSGATASAQPEQAILYITTEPPNLNGAPVEKWDEEKNEIRRKGIWENVSAQSKAAFRVRTAQMFHTNFQDAALLPPDSMPENLRANRFGQIDGWRGIRLSSELVRRFFDAHLKSAPLDEFLKIEKQYPEIRIQSKTR